MIDPRVLEFFRGIHHRALELPLCHFFGDDRRLCDLIFFSHHELTFYGGDPFVKGLLCFQLFRRGTLVCKSGLQVLKELLNPLRCW